MTARRRAAALAMCALALLVAAAATLVYTRTRTAAMPLEKITIAVSSTPHAALLHLAAAKGFFAAEGLDASITPVSHGKAAIDLLAQGKADLAAAAEVPFVISVLNGEPFAIAATVA